MQEGAAFIVSDILADRAARSVTFLTFGLDSALGTTSHSAVKTGTSKDLRETGASATRRATRSGYGWATSAASACTRSPGSRGRRRCGTRSGTICTGCPKPVIKTNIGRTGYNMPLTYLRFRARTKSPCSGGAGG